MTTIVRDADGVATAIDSPFGQRTALTQHADGYLASAANPAGETVSFLYSDGLMTQLTDPRGSVKNYSYSALGRLSQAADENIGAERGIQTYSRDRADGKPSYKVERRTQLGESTKYSVVKKRGGLEIRRQQYADGTVALTKKSSAGGQVESIATTGQKSTSTRGPDPRFGMAASFSPTQTVEMPSGLSATTSSTGRSHWSIRRTKQWSAR
ncbi:MAG: hypothetical protein HC937_01715 [Aquincola sp.]|nr:hypothetical protein [Aquincola sp.]